MSATFYLTNICMKKYISIFTLVALCVIAVGVVFVIEKQKQKEEVLSQPWKTISVSEFGVSVEYPSNLSAVYGWQDGDIHFFEGDVHSGSLNSQKVAGIDIWLMPNTQEVHQSDGVYKNKTEYSSWWHTYMSATVVKGDKIAGFQFRDFDEAVANRMIDSIKFFDAVPVQHPGPADK
jgi:hypothetical protein